MFRPKPPQRSTAGRGEVAIVGGNCPEHEPHARPDFAKLAVLRGRGGGGGAAVSAPPPPTPPPPSAAPRARAGVDAWRCRGVVAGR